MDRRQHALKRDLMWWADDVDPHLVVRGASRGFSVFLLGGLALPVVVALVPDVGRVWLPLVALLAFVVSALRVGSARKPWLHGLVSALSAYLLILPLVLLGGAADPWQIGLTVVAGVVTGSATGGARGKIRNRPQ